MAHVDDLTGLHYPHDYSYPVQIHKPRYQLKQRSGKKFDPLTNEFIFLKDEPLYLVFEITHNLDGTRNSQYVGTLLHTGEFLPN